MRWRCGWEAWIRSFALWLVIGSFFARWAAARGEGVADPVAFFLSQALFACVFAGTALTLLRRFGFAWQMIFAETFPWTSLAALPGLLDFGWGMFFPSSRPAFVTVSDALTPFLTLGLLPHPLSTVGFSATLLFSLAIFWRWLRRAANAKTARIFVVSLGGMWSALLLVPSFVGWTHLTLGDAREPFFGTSREIERALSAIVADGYWWKQAHWRFSYPIGNEARASVERLFEALAFLLVVSAAFARSPLRKLRWRDRADFFRTDLAAAVGSLASLGWLIAAAQGIRLDGRFGDVVAVCVLLASVFAAWFFLTGRNDLFDLARDERRERPRPLARGMFSVSELQGILPVFATLSLVGAWLLGWPIFFAFAVIFAVSEIYVALPPFREKDVFSPRTGLQAVAAYAFMLAHWFFARAEGDWKAAPFRLFAGLALGWAFLSEKKRAAIEAKRAKPDGSDS